MKRRIKSLLCQLLVAGLGLMLEGRVMAQTFATVHNFTAVVFGTNGDGTTPITELILLGNTLYGTAYDGGTNGSGTVFAINTNGTGFSTLHTFTVLSGSNSTNSDGAIRCIFLSPSKGNAILVDDEKMLKTIEN